MSARFKVVVETQVYENYAAHDYDGKGPAPEPYWKAKGGNTYIVARISLEEAVKGRAYIHATYIEPALPNMQRNDHWYHEYLVDWELVDIHEPTSYEREQLRWEDGFIYLAQDITQAVGEIAKSQTPDRLSIGMLR